MRAHKVLQSSEDARVPLALSACANLLVGCGALEYMLCMLQVQREAIQAVEQDGIVFIDEIDKIVVNQDLRYGELPFADCRIYSSVLFAVLSQWENFRPSQSSVTDCACLMALAIRCPALCTAAGREYICPVSLTHRVIGCPFLCWTL